MTVADTRPDSVQRPYLPPTVNPLHQLPTTPIDVVVAVAVLSGMFCLVVACGRAGTMLGNYAFAGIIMHSLLAASSLLYLLTRPKDMVGVQSSIAAGEQVRLVRRVTVLVVVLSIAMPIAITLYNYARSAEYTERDPLSLVIFLILVCCLAPISEELLWRKSSYHLLRRRARYSSNPKALAWLYLILVPLVFGLSHRDMLQSILVIPLGTIATVVYFTTKSLKFAIAIHMFYNITNVTVEAIAKPLVTHLYPSDAALLWPPLIGLTFCCAAGVVFVLWKAIAAEISVFGAMSLLEPLPENAQKQLHPFDPSLYEPTVMHSPYDSDSQQLPTLVSKPRAVERAEIVQKR